MKVPLRVTLLPLVITALVGAGACSGGSTPVDPKASSERDVDGGLVPHETAQGAIGQAAALGVAPAVNTDRETWRKSMARNPTQKAGCFRASYPSTTWEEVACAPKSEVPTLPARFPDVSASLPQQVVPSGTRSPDLVGAGNSDWSASTASLGRRGRFPPSTSPRTRATFQASRFS